MGIRDPDFCRSILEEVVTLRTRLTEIHEESETTFAFAPHERKKKMAENTKGKEGSDAWDSTQWYVVKKGDTISKISREYYGDPNLYVTIFEANRDILKDPNLIKVGQKLRIP